MKTKNLNKWDKKELLPEVGKMKADIICSSRNSLGMGTLLTFSTEDVILLERNPEGNLYITVKDGGDLEPSIIPIYDFKLIQYED